MKKLLLNLWGRQCLALAPLSVLACWFHTQLGAYGSGRTGFPEGSLPDVPPTPCAHPILWDELPEWGLLLDWLGLVLDGLHMGP